MRSADGSAYCATSWESNPPPAVTRPSTSTGFASASGATQSVSVHRAGDQLSTVRARPEACGWRDAAIRDKDRVSSRREAQWHEELTDTEVGEDGAVPADSHYVTGRIAGRTVQCKHHTSTISGPEVQQLVGTLAPSELAVFGPSVPIAKMRSRSSDRSRACGC